MNGSANVSINPLPTPSFTIAPASSVCASTDVTYTTQAGQSNYTWNVPGSPGTDYSIISGGIGSNSNTVTLKWLTTGSKTVTVNYTDANSCSATTSASSVTTVDPLLPVSVSVSSDVSTICQGETVKFTATPQHGGTAPTFQWRIDGYNKGTASAINKLSIDTFTVSHVVTVSY